MRKQVKLHMIFGLLLVLCFFALPVFAQPSSTGKDVAPSPSQRESRIESNTYGIASFTNLWIPAAAFVPHDDTVTWERVGDYGGAIKKTSTGFSSFWAPVNLPNGADVYGVELHYSDNSTDDYSFYCFTRYDVDDYYYNYEVCELLPEGTPGLTTYSFDPYPELNIIDNNSPYVVHIFPELNTGGDFYFMGVKIIYRLQVSPAPGTATFSDVPTSHPFFQYVEALASSGITAGCGGGNYCPDAPLTRGQMAVFLSKALGLHWPN